jgi:hypothetical protein
MPAVVIAAAVAGTAATVYSANKASKTATNINNQNQAEIDQTQAENTALLKPYTDSTNAAGKAYNGFIGLNGAEAQTAAKGQFDSYKDAAGYNFNLQNGSDALNSSNAAKGMLKSGSALKGLAKYQTGLADTYAQNWQNSLSGQQGAGLSAANALAGVGTNYVNQVTNNNNNAAGAKADNYINQANLFSNFLGNSEKRFAQVFGSSYG